jgi:hypothetical protein
MPRGLRNQSHRRARGRADTQPLHARQPGSSAAMPGVSFEGVRNPPDFPAELHSHKAGRGEHPLTRRGLAGRQVASCLRGAAGGTFQSLPGGTSATHWNSEVFFEMSRRVDDLPGAAADAPACLAAPALALALPDRWVRWLRSVGSSTMIAAMRENWGVVLAAVGVWASRLSCRAPADFSPDSIQLQGDFPAFFASQQKNVVYMGGRRGP